MTRWNDVPPGLAPSLFRRFDFEKKNKRSEEIQ